jgi:CBS domain-containing protein
MHTGSLDPIRVLEHLDHEDRFALERALVRVRMLMTREVVMLDVGAPVRDAIHLFSTKQFRHVLVTDGTQLAGVVSDRDVLRALLRSPDAGNAPVATVMTKDPIVVGPDAPISEAIHLLTSNRINCLPVVEGGRHVQGILTTTDLLNALFALQRWIESRVRHLES